MSQRSGVKYPPGMGSAPPESRLKELLLPPPMVGLKMGALGTTAALTVAESERNQGMGGSEAVVGPQKGSPDTPCCMSPLLPSAVPLPQRRAELCQGGQAESLLAHIPGLGTSWVPSEGGMVKPDSQIGEFAP